MSLIKEIAEKSKCIEKCKKTKTIEDITDQYDYEDVSPRGEGDGSLVSCGQDETYNELEYIYNKKLKDEVDSKNITHSEAINALCICCCELKSPRSRKKYYACLSQKLNIVIV